MICDVARFGACANRSHPSVQALQAVSPSNSWNEPAAHLAHALSPLAPVYVPGAQMVWSVAPSGHAEPAGQDVQSLCAAPPVEPRYEPAAQAVDALAPARQYAPAGQSAQTVSPLPDWYVPAEHDSQALAPALAAN